MTSFFLPALASLSSSLSVYGFNQGSLGSLDWNELLCLSSPILSFSITFLVVSRH